MEVSLVSALREIVVEGVLEIPVDRLLGVCMFLTILGGLLYLRVWMFTQFSQAGDEVISDSTTLYREQDCKPNLNSTATEQYSF